MHRFDAECAGSSLGSVLLFYILLKLEFYIFRKNDQL